MTVFLRRRSYKCYLENAYLLYMQMGHMQKVSTPHALSPKPLGLRVLPTADAEEPDTVARRV